MGEDLRLRNLIVSARDMPEVGAACRSAASALGFQHFVYALRIAISLSRPQQFVLSGYPSGWRSHYDAQGFMAVDPVLVRGASSVLPFGWDEIDRSAAATQRLFDAAASFGLCHGMTVPQHGMNGELGLMSLARQDPLPTGAERTRLFQRALWITGNVQERVRQLLHEAGAMPAPKLSPRERECLRHAAQGTKAGAIGAAIGIAESTVVYHLNSAERKLGVKTRGQAIARAVALGVIEPENYPSQIALSQLVEVAG